MVAGICFVAMALAQLALPLVGDRSGITTAVVVLFAATTTALAAGRWGWGRATAVGGAVVLATLVLERVGTATGWPFGDYRYTDALRPQVAGVPVAVVLAWWAMAVPAREVAACLARPGPARIALGAVALTAWDVMLDPQMVHEGYWVWDGGGPWQDVPLSNYAGWLVVSVAVMVLLDRLLPTVPSSGRPVPGLVGLYAWWAVVQTAGSLFLFGDPVVGVVGGLCMLPLAVLALRRRA